ncbi:MAG TPA: DUF6351 family protein, partial [Longimicrobiaceae bacterium]|nr:DUF6351 family protein [Longimicrobiaceae bacterium]
MKSAEKIRTYAVLAAILTLAACGLRPGAAVISDLQIVSVSTRPHLVTGDDVLLRLDGVRPDRTGLRVTLNGADVTDRFRHDPDGEMVGLLDGLVPGANRVEARLGEAGRAAVLELTNYPITGPILSGPHQEPFLCRTQEFEDVSGQPLGAAIDEDCSIERRVDYVYFSRADGEFKPYRPPTGAARPSDVATVTTLDGATVPFIVRVETGTINRGIYEIAIVHDPSTPEPSPWTRSAGWNGKLVYTHGGGCRSGWHQQGRTTGGVLREGLLEMGYGVASSTLNVFGQNCNDLLASETHIMVKERFVEGYGAPAYTIGTGG